MKKALMLVTLREEHVVGGYIELAQSAKWGENELFHGFFWFALTMYIQLFKVE